MAECLSFFDVIEGKSSQLSFKVAVGKSIDTDMDNRNANLIKQTMPSNFDDNSYLWDWLGKNV